MKSKLTKILSLCLCTLFVFGSVGSMVWAQAGGGQKPQPSMDNPTTSAPAAAGESKDETVYVLAGADGSVQKIIVSDWIKNSLGSGALSDASELTDTVNVRGDESYTPGGGNTRVWDAQGNDIYYQGSIEKELPVSLHVSYRLNGKQIAPDDLVGKSGRVTIRFDYENTQYEMVTINGKQEKIYVPFAMLTGLLLDNDVFRNVEVSNGKLINDGSRTAVAGLAFPGLRQSLALGDGVLEIPEYVEISADAENISLGTTVTIATNEVFNQLNTGLLDSTDDLTGALGKLPEAMGQLVDGSSQLYDGLCTLLEKSGELVSGIDQLASGALALKNGANDLDAGAAKLRDGAAQLSAGLDTLAENNASLNGGARQVFDTLLSTARTQLAAAGLSVPDMTVSNYAEVLNGVIASLDETSVYNQALETVTAAVKAQRGEIERQVTQAVRAEVETQVRAAVREQVAAQVEATVRQTVTEQVILAVTGMDQAAYNAAVEGGLVDEQTQAAIAAAIDEQMASEEIRQTIAAQTDAQMETEQVKATVSANVDAQMASDEIKGLIAQNTDTQVEKIISEQMAGDEVQAKLAAASEGAKSVISLKSSLDSYNAFYLGLQTYTSGVAEAARGAGELQSGAADLKAGTGALSEGASALYDGILTLKNGAPALVDGITQLRDGSMKLSDGLKELNEKGMQKLVDAAGGDLEGLTQRLHAVMEVSENYRNFSGIADGMSGQVKFIYRTEELSD